MPLHVSQQHTKEHVWQPPKKTGPNLARAAKALIKALGDETAAAIAAKLVVTYSNQAADQESARLGRAIVEEMGVERYNAASCL